MLALSEASENVKHQYVISSTNAIMFFGTPHRGSKDLVGYGEVARQAASILLDTNSALLDTLGLRTTDLERSQETFMKLWRIYDFRVETFQEGAGLTAVNVGILNKKVCCIPFSPMTPFCLNFLAFEDFAHAEIVFIGGP